MISFIAKNETFTKITKKSIQNNFVIAGINFFRIWAPFTKSKVYLPACWKALYGNRQGKIYFKLTLNWQKKIYIYLNWVWQMNWWLSSGERKILVTKILKQRNVVRECGKAPLCRNITLNFKDGKKYIYSHRLPNLFF